MEDKTPVSTKVDDPEEAKLVGSPRFQTQSACSVVSRFMLELWRRVRLEFIVEWPLLKQRWKILLFGIMMQYVHGIFTQLAHRMHQPQDQPLHDVGFDLTPELGPEKHWVSEAIFGTAFGMFVLWTFTPFVSQRKRFYTAVIWSRLLMVLVVCQALRIVTFSVTQLPGPSFHCRAYEPSARRPWPASWSGHLVVDVGRQVSKSCGDLIFSSHTTFILTGILAYNEYGSLALVKVLAWLLGVVMSILIVASRKHYTVDIVVAWYTVPLVFYAMYRRWTTRRPMSDFIGSDVSPFDDVDGIELEEGAVKVLIERSNGMSGSGEDCSKVGGGMQPRPNTLKISVRAPQDGGISRNPGGHVLLGYFQGGTIVNVGTPNAPDANVHGGSHGQAVAARVSRSAVESLDASVLAEEGGAAGQAGAAQERRFDWLPRS